MKISIATVGTRGDIQPYIVLALSLQDAGFDVTVCGSPNFKGWAGSLGLRYVGSSIDYNDVMESANIRRVVEGDLVTLARIWRREVIPLLDDTLEAAERAAADADAIIYDLKVLGVADIAEARNIPAICMATYPSTTATRAFPVPSFPFFQMTTSKNLGGALNRASFEAARIQRILFLNRIQKWRRETLGLSAGPRFPQFGENRKGRLPRMHPVSPHVAPEPDDWDSNVRNTGFLYLDNPTGALDPELGAFLEKGEAPVYFGFGSMLRTDADAFTDLIFEGIERSGARAVIEKGWGGMAPEDTPAHIFQSNRIPHADLLPHMRALVHHGGCGTVAAGLRAGKPSFIVPFSFAQPWWGRRLNQLDLGPPPIRAKELTSRMLAQRIDEVCHTASYAQNVAAVSEKIAEEDGRAGAVRFVSEQLGV
ncbi:MAG: glycosyltransferase [Pseudomonadota bacterium]